MRGWNLGWSCKVSSVLSAAQAPARKGVGPAGDTAGPWGSRHRLGPPCQGFSPGTATAHHFQLTVPVLMPHPLSQCV